MVKDALLQVKFNLSSDSDTLTSGDTVIYRRSDMAALVAQLRDRGHEVEPFVLGPDTHPLDYYVDVPPYSNDIHLKLRIADYTTTSVGIVVRRSADV